jgi:hypothetical protein
MALDLDFAAGTKQKFMDFDPVVSSDQSRLQTIPSVGNLGIYLMRYGKGCWLNVK